MLYAIIAVAGLAAGIVMAILAAYAIQAKNNRRRKKRRITADTDTQEQSRRKIEFSKIVLGFVMLTYFVGLGFGIYAVSKILLDYPEYAIQALIALFGYVGTPITTAIGFYSWKAKAENALKIVKNNPKETEGVTVDPSAII